MASDVADVSGEDSSVETTAIPTPSSSFSREAQKPHDDAFAVSASELADMVQKRRLDEFRRLGGLAGIAQLLQTDCGTGLNFDEPYAEDAAGRRPTPGRPDIESNHSQNLQRIREEAFGTNQLPDPKVEGFFGLAWEALGGWIMKSLVVCGFFKVAHGVCTEEASQFIGGCMMLTIVAVSVFLTANTEAGKSKEFSDLAKTVCAFPFPLLPTLLISFPEGRPNGPSHPIRQGR